MDSLEHRCGIPSCRHRVGHQLKRSLALRELARTPRSARFVFADYNHPNPQRPDSGAPSQCFNFISLRPLDMPILSNRQRSSVMMHTPAFVEHRVFVRVVNCAGLYQRSNQAGLTAKAASRYDHSPSSPAHDTRMNEDPVRRGLSYKKLKIRFKRIDCLIQLRRPGDSNIICVNQIETTMFAGLLFCSDDK